MIPRYQTVPVVTPVRIGTYTTFDHTATNHPIRVRVVDYNEPNAMREMVNSPNYRPSSKTPTATYRRAFPSGVEWIVAKAENIYWRISGRT